MRWVAAAVLLVACSVHASPLEEKYPRARFETRRFDGYGVEGLTLWRVTAPSVPDRNGDRFLVGVDRAGALVEGWDLFRRAAPGRSPAELTARVFDILLRGHGRPVDPATDRRSEIFPEAEWALARAPAVEDHLLTFWYVEGEMAPRVTRGTLDLATGKLERRSARDVLHPPEAALPGIRAKLRSPDVATVREGLLAVSEWAALAPDVEALLRSPDRQVRSAAIGVLGNLGQPRSVKALAAMLADGPEWGDRSLAGQALVTQFGTPEAIAAVRAHVARGGSGHDVAVLRDLLKAKGY
jgi:hypothetical protein